MRWVPVLLAFAAGAAAQDLKPEPAAPAPTLAAGKTYEATSPGKRPYLYRVPDKGPRPPSLIIMLHGTGMKYGWPFWNYPIHTGHFRKYDFVVAPESEDPDRGFIQGKADRDEVVGLIKLFRKTWPEIENVYLYGHSQGAFFCYYFAGEQPDLIDGIVAHAGNFFKSKLDKGAREKVAIGILHGRADAVVTVQCAFTTFLTYREGGYEHVKLMVVEGLNDQTGHWPLPWHVPRMLAWCDRASAKSAVTAAEAALEELAQEEPDLAAVAQAVALGRELLKKATPEEARPAAERLDAVAALLDAAKASFGKTLLPRADAESGANGPWATELRIAVAAFGDAWLEGTPALKKAVARDTKAIDEALKGLSKGSKKSYTKALETGQKAFLGAGHDDLLLELSRWDKPGDAIDTKDLEAYRALAPDFKRFADDGRREAMRLWATELRAFQTDHAGWLAPYRQGE